MSLLKKSLIVLLVILFFSWCLVSLKSETNKGIYQKKLARVKPDNIEGYYQLGLWCLQNELPEQALVQFKQVIKLKPNHKSALEHIKKLEAEAIERELVKKYGVYKGVLNKPGAERENLPWEKARKMETEHFIVKTNLSNDALNDICFLLEVAYLKWHDFFGFPDPKQKLRVALCKNKAEFGEIHRKLIGINSPLTSSGVFIPRRDPANKSRKDWLVAYYNPRGGVRIVMHEGTHYAVALVGRAARLTFENPPKWLDEGLATYFESSWVDDSKLVTNVVNHARLSVVKRSLDQGNYIKLKRFINLAYIEYSSYSYYAQGWSLVYFLINGQEGKYKPGFKKYIDAWKKKKIIVKAHRTKGSWVPNPNNHVKVFEKCMGVPIDQLEEEWQTAIKNLE